MNDKIGPALETMHEEEDDRLEQIARYVPMLWLSKEEAHGHSDRLQIESTQQRSTQEEEWSTR